MHNTNCAPRAFPSEIEAHQIRLHRAPDFGVAVQVGAWLWLTPERAVDLAARLVAYAEPYSAETFDDALKRVNEG